MPFIVLLGIVVIVHELGHLLIARANGVFCEVFSVGYGPTLWERKDKYGTRWRLSLFPLGGYVKMFGDADVASVKEVVPAGYTEDDLNRMSAHRKQPWQRLLISIGGPLANFVFSIVVLFAIAIVNGIPRYSNTITVSDHSVAYSAGLRSGDEVIEANSKEISDFAELRNQIVSSKGETLEVRIKRDEEVSTISIDMFEEKDGKIVPISVLGIAPKEIYYEKSGVLGAIKAALVTTYDMASSNIVAIFKIITGSMSAKNIGGIISIFKISSDSIAAGLASFIFMIAAISTTLGAINLLPIPVLDGGAVVIAMVEQILGRPLNKKLVEIIFTVGLAIVIGLMVVGTWNDLMRCKALAWIGELVKNYFG